MDMRCLPVQTSLGCPASFITRIYRIGDHIMGGTINMNKVKVAVIGCGGIATGKHLPSLSKIEQVEIIGFFDIFPASAQQCS